MQTVGTAVIPAASDSAMASDEAFPALTVPKLTYLRGKVTRILQETQLPDQELALFFQTVQVKLANSDELVSIQIGNEFQPLNAQQRLRVNEELVIGKQELSNGQVEYVVADVYRLPILLWLFVGFLALVVLIAKKQGASAIVGMCLSFAVLMLFGCSCTPGKYCSQPGETRWSRQRGSLLPPIWPFCETQSPRSSSRRHYARNTRCA